MPREISIQHGEACRQHRTFCDVRVAVGRAIRSDDICARADVFTQQGVTSDPLCSERCVHAVYLYSNCALIASQQIVCWWRFCIVADQGLTLG